MSRTGIIVLTASFALAGCSSSTGDSNASDAGNTPDVSTADDLSTTPDTSDSSSPVDTSGPPPVGSANYSASLGVEPDFSVPHSRIVVKTWFTFGETSLSGFFADGPALSQHVESERIGNCRLMRPTITLCDPACTGGDLCIDGGCRSWPQRVDRGELTWTWPDGQKTVAPDNLLGYYATGAATTEGDISISVDGLTLEAPNSPQLIPDGDWAAQLAQRLAGQDFTLRWTNPVGQARVRLHMTDCVGSHGGVAAAEIECEGPDTGELVLPGAFLDALEAGDWTHGECGSHAFARYHAAAPVGDTLIRLETVSDAGFFYFPGQ